MVRALSKVGGTFAQWVRSPSPFFAHQILELYPVAVYSGEGENIGTCRGVVELLELVVILLF